ncbi:hypothetical protein Fmac_021175 [Flemingia macrophylla]|uniref:Uncharacterized protein n=1 Tax=Flemingia macrophylla TaxID=520843 RepID=A0ABD1LW36_9FABA
MKFTPRPLSRASQGASSQLQLLLVQNVFELQELQNSGSSKIQNPWIVSSHIYCVRAVYDEAGQVGHVSDAEHLFKNALLCLASTMNARLDSLEFSGTIALHLQFPDTVGSIISFKVDSDIISLDGKEPLQTQAELGSGRWCSKQRGGR